MSFLCLMSFYPCKTIHPSTICQSLFVAFLLVQQYFLDLNCIPGRSWAWETGSLGPQDVPRVESQVAMEL